MFCLKTLCEETVLWVKDVWLTLSASPLVCQILQLARSKDTHRG